MLQEKEMSMPDLVKIKQVATDVIEATTDAPMYHGSVPYEVWFDYEKNCSFLVRSDSPPDWLLRSVLSVGEGVVASVRCVTQKQLHITLAHPVPARPGLDVLVSKVATELERAYMRGGRLRDRVVHHVELF